MTKAKARRKGSVSPKKQTPPPQKKAARQQYPQGALADALQEVQEKIKSLRQIAKDYKIPVQTLHRHATGKTKSTSIGRQPYLTREAETRIAKNVLAWHDRGLSLTVCQLKSFALHVAKQLQPGSSLVRTWTAKGVSAKWTRGFLGRHTYISVRIADNLDHKRRSVTEAQIDQFYKLIAQVCTCATTMHLVLIFKITHDAQARVACCLAGQCTTWSFPSRAHL